MFSKVGPVYYNIISRETGKKPRSGLVFIIEQDAIYSTKDGVANPGNIFSVEDVDDLVERIKCGNYLRIDSGNLPLIAATIERKLGAEAKERFFAIKLAKKQ